MQLHTEPFHCMRNPDLFSSRTPSMSEDALSDLGCFGIPKRVFFFEIRLRCCAIDFVGGDFKGTRIKSKKRHCEPLGCLAATNTVRNTGADGPENRRANALRANQVSQAYQA